MLGKSEWDRAYHSCRKMETGRGSHIDRAKIETGWAKWMRGGASLKQGEANRNGLRVRTIRNGVGHVKKGIGLFGSGHFRHKLSLYHSIYIYFTLL